MQRLTFPASFAGRDWALQVGGGESILISEWAACGTDSSGTRRAHSGPGDSLHRIMSLGQQKVWLLVTVGSLGGAVDCIGCSIKSLELWQWGPHTPVLGHVCPLFHDCPAPASSCPFNEVIFCLNPSMSVSVSCHLELWLIHPDLEALIVLLKHSVANKTCL